ncbi:MAG TPA: DMT family transporter [Candidatus Limnocylindrales bacterium]|nr:DMT family transporter [Candidatus Limnocylindrales bacterium]
MAAGAASPVPAPVRWRPSQVGLFAMLASVLGYSFLPVFTAKLLELGVEPVEIGLWRYALTVPVFWGIALAAGWRTRTGPKPESQRLPNGRLMLLGILLAAAALTAFFGLQRIPAGTYVVIFYTYPAFTALLLLTMGDRLSGWGWVALGLTLVGVMLTAPDFSEGLAGGNLTGVLLALLNALIVAVYFILNSRLLKDRSALVRAAALTTTGALAALAVVGLLLGARLPAAPEAWVYLVGMALVSTVLPIFMTNVGIQRLGPARAAILGSVEPLLTSLIALAFLGQMMAPVQWAGGLVIVASVVMLQTLGSRRASNTLLTDV